MPSLNRDSNYKWVNLCLCFLMVFVCLGFCSGNKGMYLTAITDALGIRRSLFSINDTCRYVSTAVVNLFFGTLVARFGVRRMTAFGFLALIASSLLYAAAEHIYLFCLGGALLGAGLAFTTTSMASVIIRRWFKTNLGTWTGIVLAANGLGNAVAAQIISPMINEPGNPFGYRTSYRVVAIILLAVGALVFLLLRERPKGAAADEPAPKKKARGASWVGIDYRTARTRPYFYLTAAGVLMTGFLLQSISGVYVAHMRDVGLSAAFVATLVSIHALTLTAAKLGVGALYDRFGLQAVMLLCQGAGTVTFLLMAMISTSGAGHAFAAAFAVLYSLALPLETLVIPLIANDLFGSASYEKILGILLSVSSIGYALGAPIINLCRDLSGSYRPVLLVYSVLMLVICVVFRFVIKAAYRDKQAILAQASVQDA